MKTVKTTYKLGTLLRGISSDSYHKYPGSFSSTQLKTLADSKELFFKKYIEKSIPREENEAFDVGTYFHTAILEPEKLEKECAVFKDGFRRGPKWEAFKQKHKNKAIITLSDKDKADKMINAVNNSELTLSLLKDGHSELSLFMECFIGESYIGLKGKEDIVYDYSYGGLSGKKVPPQGLTKVILKVRADKFTSKAILDLKSSSFVSDNANDMRGKVKAYGYDFSAAMYHDLFHAATGKKRDFIWVFACKTNGVVRNFRASEKTLQEGRELFIKSLFSLREGMISGWNNSESILEL